MNNVRVLQRELYRAAKAQKERRFGVLYDKVYLEKVDRYVWWRLRWRYYVEHRKRRRGMRDFPRDLKRESGLYRLRGTLRRYGAEY